MLRAIAMAARLGFTIDAPIDAAIADSRGRNRPKCAGEADRGVLQAPSLGCVGAGIQDDGRAPASRADRS